MIELILTLIMSFGTGRMHFKPQPRRPPPGECRAAYTVQGQPQVSNCQPPSPR